MASKSFRWFMILFVIAGVFSAFRIGLDRDFEHTIGAEAYGRMSFAFCAAITDLAHHGSGGYVCNEVVETVLAYAGLTADEHALAALGRKYPDNLRDQTLLDNAIRKAVSFPITPAQAQFRGGGADDIGMVDFSKLAFTLFGYNLLSLYLTYFALFSASVWAFMHAFSDRPAYLAILAVAVTAHLALLGSAIFNFTAYTFGTVTNPRFLSAIAIIPGMHLAFSMMNKTQLSKRHAAMVAFQASIIVLAISIRAVAMWVPFGLAVLAGALWLTRRSLRSLWPLTMFVAIFLAYTVYVVQALSPIYKSMGGTGRHTIWHSVYYSLQAHPDWSLKYGESHQHATGDQQPWIAAENYLARHPIQGGDPPLYLDRGYPNFTAMEKYVRAAFFEFALNDPKFVIETFVIYKPRELFSITWQYWTDVLYSNGAVVWLCYGLGVILIIFFASNRMELVELSKGSALLTGALILSIVPLLVTVPVISDDLLLLTMLTGLWIVVVLSLFVSFVAAYGQGNRVKKCVTNG
jgi:hypothetical protein